MKVEPARPIEPFAVAQREFLVEVYGPLFGAIGRLTLPAPVRLSDFVNEREGFLRLTDVELTTNGEATTPQTGPMTEYLINKTGIELICQPPAEAIERRSEVDKDVGKSLWQALNKMAVVDANSGLRVPKERHYVQVHTHRFTVGAYLHLAHGASLDAVLSNLPTKFVPVTDASARFIGGTGQPTTIERKLMLVNRDHILLVAPAVTS
jgi:hypothetical protein